MSTGKNEVPGKVPEAREVHEVKDVQKRKDTRASGVRIPSATRRLKRGDCAQRQSFVDRNAMNVRLRGEAREQSPIPYTRDLEPCRNERVPLSLLKPDA